MSEADTARLFLAAQRMRAVEVVCSAPSFRAAADLRLGGGTRATR